MQRLDEVFAEEQGLSAEDRFLKLYLLNQVQYRGNLSAGWACLACL